MTGAGSEALRLRVREREQAVAAAPGDPSVRSQLAEAYDELAGHQQKAAAPAQGDAAGGAIHLLVEAIGFRRKAAEAWTEAARLAPGDAAVQTGRARSLSRLAANLSRTGADTGDVLGIMQAAVDAYGEAFRIAPGDGDGHTRRGALLSAIGVAHQRNDDHGAASGCYREALIDLKEAQKLAPTNPAIVSEAGWVLVRLGGAEGALGKSSEAIASLESAIGVFAEVRRLAPRNPFGPLSQGQAYTALGEAQASQPPYLGPPDPSRVTPVDRGISAYRQAIACFDAALQLEPGDTVTASVKAETLQGLGELLVLASRGQEALTAYSDALVLYDGTLAGNTQSFQYQLGRGRSLLRAGELAADLGDAEASLSNLEAARAELSRDVPIEAVAGGIRAGLLERVERHLDGGTGDPEPEPRPN